MGIRKTLAVRAAHKRINGVPDPTLTNFASLLKAKTDADAGFISFVTTDRAYIVGAAGLPPERMDPDGIPVQESFCAHLVDSDDTDDTDGLIVNNTRIFPMLKDCPTIDTFGSWVGAPIHYHGQVIGASGVAGHQPRNWPEETLTAVRATANAVERELSGQDAK
jgi:GAF domain-containing protein